MDQLPITLRQLSYFVALSDTGHFRRAAERCGISQPSLSTQIQALEQALGVALVERSRSGVALTPVGRDIVARSRAILEDVQGVIDHAGIARHGLVGTIRLGAKPTLGPYLLPHVVARLHRQYPDLNLHIREGGPRDLESELSRGVHDVILAQLPISGSELVAHRLFREPLYVVLAADHPLASRETIAASALQGLRVLSLEPQYQLHEQVDDLCREFGAILERGYEGNTLDALRQMVGMGMGISFMPALYVRSEIGSRSEVVVRPLEGRTISRSVGIVWRKSAGRAEAYERIADVMRDVVRRKFKNLTLEW